MHATPEGGRLQAGRSTYSDFDPCRQDRVSLPAGPSGGSGTECRIRVHRGTRCGSPQSLQGILTACRSLRALGPASGASRGQDRTTANLDLDQCCAVLDRGNLRHDASTIFSPG